MSNGIGLLSKRVKKIPSTQVADDRYTFLDLNSAEPDLGVPDQDEYVLISDIIGNRAWVAQSGLGVSTVTDTFIGTDENPLVLFSKLIYGSAKITIQATDNVTGERQISEMLIVHNGTDVDATEFGVIQTNDISIASFDVNIAGNDVVISATNATPNETEYRVARTLIPL